MILPESLVGDDCLVACQFTIQLIEVPWWHENELVRQCFKQAVKVHATLHAPPRRLRRTSIILVDLAVSAGRWLGKASTQRSSSSRLNRV